MAHSKLDSTLQVLVLNLLSLGRVSHYLELTGSTYKCESLVYEGAKG